MQRGHGGADPRRNAAATAPVHTPGLEDQDFAQVPDRLCPLASLPPLIDLHERLAAAVTPTRVVAAAPNTSLIEDPDEAGLPRDPFRFGPERLWPRIRAAVEALPWVAGGA